VIYAMVDKEGRVSERVVKKTPDAYVSNPIAQDRRNGSSVLHN